jgi:hypothetical protein
MIADTRDEAARDEERMSRRIRSRFNHLQSLNFDWRQ